MCGAAAAEHDGQITDHRPASATIASAGAASPSGGTGSTATDRSRVSVSAVSTATPSPSPTGPATQPAQPSWLNTIKRESWPFSRAIRTSIPVRRPTASRPCDARGAQSLSRTWCTRACDVGDRIHARSDPARPCRPARRRECSAHRDEVPLQLANDSRSLDYALRERSAHACGSAEESRLPSSIDSAFDLACWSSGSLITPLSRSSANRASSLAVPLMLTQ